MSEKCKGFHVSKEAEIECNKILASALKRLEEDKNR